MGLVSLLRLNCNSQFMFIGRQGWNDNVDKNKNNGVCFSFQSHATYTTYQNIKL